MPTEPLTWFEVLKFVGIPSVFGGLLQGLYKYVYSSYNAQRENQIRATGPHRNQLWSVRGFLGLGISGLFGVGGGAAVVLASIWLNKFSYAATDQNKVYLVVLGVVAGFVGHRILPRVARGLEERVATSETESRLAIQEARKAASEAAKSANSAHRAFVLAQVAAARTKDDFRKILASVKGLLDKEPLDHSLNFILARVYKRASRLDDAKNVMSTFLRMKEDRGEIDKTYSDALFNRACYQALKWEQSEGRDQDALSGALADLEAAIRLDQINKDDAWEDEDFEALRTDRNPTFFRLVDRPIPEQ